MYVFVMSAVSALFVYSGTVIKVRGIGAAYNITALIFSYILGCIIRVSAERFYENGEIGQLMQYSDSRKENSIPIFLQNKIAVDFWIYDTIISEILIMVSLSAIIPGRSLRNIVLPLKIEYFVCSTK